MAWWQIIILILLVYLFIRWHRRLSSSKKMIGKDVVIAYFDRNPDAERIFPVSGVVVGMTRIAKGEYIIVELEESISLNSYEYPKLVLKERKIGRFGNITSEIHVIIFLPRVELDKETLQPDDVEMLAWGIMKPPPKEDEDDSDDKEERNSPLRSFLSRHSSR